LSPLPFSTIEQRVLEYPTCLDMSARCNFLILGLV
jgi:hypothetical protein